jgi:hypothetical protein
MTVWSGALRFAATATPSPDASVQAASTSAVAQAEHGGHGPGALAAGAQHQLAPAAHQPGPRR